MTDNTDSSNSGDRTGQQPGNYRLLRLLGEGRDAQVYLAEHVELGQQTAVKVFQMELSERDSKLFYEQVRSFAPLLHPRILRVHEAGMHGSTPFLVMDYAPNGTLRTRHPQGTVLAPDTLVPYVKDIADALRYAHDQGVSHQNLRPENILVGSREELYIADFAIPIIMQNIRSTDLSDVARNMIYTAPETSPGAGGDQYALASMTYEWLSGTSTYQGTGVEVVFQRMTRPPLPLHEHVPSIASAIEAVVMRGLEKKPERRFASIQAFAEAFEQACATGTTVTGVIQPVQGAEVSTPRVTTTLTFAYSKIERLERQRGPFSSGFSYSTHAVKTIAFSPNGRQIAFASWDSVVYICDIADGGNVFSYKGHSEPVHGIAWSPDGAYLATASGAETAGDVQVWKAENGELVFTYKGHAKQVQCAQWSPDGKRIASGSEDGTAQVWEALTGEPVLTYENHNGPVEMVAWSPDGHSIASGSDDKTVRVWDAQSGKDILAYAGPGTILALAWSPKGKLIASGGDITPVMQEDGTISRSDEQALHVWDAATGKDVLAFGRHLHRVYSLCWSSDGKYVALSSLHQSVDVYDATTGEHVAFHSGHKDSVFSIAWSPNGKSVASASQDGTVRVWKVDESPWDHQVVIQDIPG